MSSLPRSWVTRWACTRGASAITYLVVVALVALASLPAIHHFRSSTAAALQRSVAHSARLSPNGQPSAPLSSDIAQAVAEDAAVHAASGGLALTALELLAPDFSPIPGGRKRNSRPATDRGDAPLPPGTRGAPRGARARGDDATPDPERHASRDPADGACPGGVCSGQDRCFAAGTPILTPDGFAPIETIEPGALVASRSETTGELRYQRVLRTFERQARSLVVLQLLNAAGEEALLHATPEHPIWTADAGWVEAAALWPGAVSVDAWGDEVQVLGVHELPITSTVYNFEVEQFHTYFAGQTALWVHNMCGKGKGTAGKGKASAAAKPSARKPRDPLAPKKTPMAGKSERTSSRIAAKKAASRPPPPSGDLRDAMADAQWRGDEHTAYGSTSGVRAEIKDSLRNQVNGTTPPHVPDHIREFAEKTHREQRDNEHYVEYWADDKNRPESAVGRIVGSAGVGRDNAPDPLVREIDTRYDDRGHLVPSDGVTILARNKVDQAGNIVPEQATVNQKYKTAFEEFVKDYAATHPRDVVFTIHAPHYNGDELRPDFITHYMVVNGDVVAAVTFHNPKLPR